MRIAAIIANLVQIIIILSVFLLQGISLGGLTILALFILLIIACFNLLVSLFSGDEDKGALVTDKKAIVKRQDLRVSYISSVQPTLRIGDQRYDVLDLAESGVRIAVGRHERLKKRSKCQIDLVCGETMHVKTVAIRRNGDEAALAFRPPIEYPLILKEKQAANAL